MNANEELKLQGFIDRILDGARLNGEEVVELDELLQCKEARDFYIKSIELASSMPHALEHLSVMDALEVPRPKLKVWRPALAAAAALLCLFIGVKFSLREEVVDSAVVSTAKPQTQGGQKAEITGVFGVQREQSAGQGGDAENIVIDAGLIELTHKSGTRVLIEGPASYRVVEENRARLEYGKIVAKVPKTAVGFTVEYPNGEVVDLGTEFGMEVSRNGDFSMGVFEGFVEMHTNGGNRVSLVSMDHALRQLASSPELVESVPFDRGNYVRSLPSREFSWEMKQEGSNEISFDVSNLIWTPGKYRGVLKWMEGHDAIDILQAGIFCNGELVSEDIHKGTVGLLHMTGDNIYEFEVPPVEHQKAKWEMKVILSTRSYRHDPRLSVSTKGVMLFEEGLALDAKREDFIGVWQYEHDGSTWERRVHADGKIELFENGVLKPGFKSSDWFVEDGVMKVWIPHHEDYEEHILRDKDTLIFINRPYRNAHRIH